jgi:hypothetical protein
MIAKTQPKSPTSVAIPKMNRAIAMTASTTSTLRETSNMGQYLRFRLPLAEVPLSADSHGLFRLRRWVSTRRTTRLDTSARSRSRHATAGCPHSRRAAPLPSHKQRVKPVRRLGAVKRSASHPRTPMSRVSDFSRRPPMTRLDQVRTPSTLLSRATPRLRCEPRGRVVRLERQSSHPHLSGRTE